MAFTKINAAGIGTTETVTVDGLTVINDGSFGGNLTVGGVLTYEDVTNVDSVGLITARNGIVVGSGITLSKDGDIFATGITTVSGNVKVGTGITLSPDGDVFFTGVGTGNGSGLTALNASNLASGTVPTARLGSGTASSSTFLRGDSTFQVVNTDLVSDTSPQLGGNLASNGNNIDVADSTGSGNNRIKFGTSADLSIYHNGNHSFIEDSGTGSLRVLSNNIQLLNAAGNETMMQGTESGAVELYYAASKKIETTSTGVTITGNLSFADNHSIRLGNSSDFIMYHEDAGHTYLQDQGNGALRIRSDSEVAIQKWDGSTNENMAQFHPDGAVELYHNGLKKFSTNTNGAQIHAEEGGGATLILTSDEGDDNADNWRLHANPNHNFLLQTYASGSYADSIVVTSSGEVTKPTQPSFTASSTGTWTHGSSTGYLDIDINMNEEFDIGGNYNGQIFTAPVTGKYFFSYTFQYQCTSGYIVVSLRKGVSGSYSAYGRMNVYPPQQSAVYAGPGIIGIMHLDAGNTVKPVAEVNYSGNKVSNVNFSGYLLG